MTADLLPDIPRLFTAIAEAMACSAYVLLVRRRHGNAATAAVLVAGLGVLLVVHLTADRLPVSLWTLGMAAAVAVMCTTIAAAADVSLHEAGYLTARAFVLAELVASFQWQIRNYLADAPFGAHIPAESALMVGVYAALFALAFWAERRHFPRDGVPDAAAGTVLTAVAIAAGTFLVSNLSFVTSAGPFTARWDAEIFYIRTLVNLAGFVALYAQQGSRMELKAAAERETLNQMLRTQHENYLRTKRSMEVVNQTYHDLKHYVHAIRAEQDPSRRAEHLDRLESSIHDYETRVESGHPVLDIILSAKSRECTDLGITLTCVVDGDTLAGMDTMDLAAFFGNALDNAIESASRIDDPERRLIRVAVYRQGGLGMVLVENSYEDDLTFSEGLPLSTKADVTHHGYGMKNMRRIILRNGGEFTVQAENGWFTVRALVVV